MDPVRNPKILKMVLCNKERISNLISNGMENKSEPHFKKSSCSYCGDAPVSHAFFYFDSLISDFLEPHIFSVAKRAPNFLKRFADWLPVLTLKIFIWFGL